MHKSGMKWAFFGSSLVSAYWNGAATYYRGIIRSLAELGHEITFYEPDAYDRQKNRDISDPDWAKVYVYDATEAAMNEALEHARDADVIVKASGVGVFDEALEAAVAGMKKPTNTVIFWDVDAPATLDRMSANERDPFRPLVPRYDLILTYGGGEPVRRKYLSFGARECIPVYNALDPSTHFPVAPDSRFEGTLGFLGNRLPDREARVEKFFLKAVGKISHERFLLGGAGWHDKPMPTNIKYIGHVYTKDHNAFNSSLRAVLNLSRDSMASYGFSPATRVFEAAGAGACIITDFWEGIDFFFEPEREILVARDGDEVAANVRELSQKRACSIGQAAYRRVLSQHTYAHRARQVDALLRGEERVSA